ncbi:MAG: T9SS type A sorting domain-containing protein [Bacteroidota bacterium]|nr:T9SS type A sorting domain-containing protein [Bacteroidota bacterium]
MKHLLSFCLVVLCCQFPQAQTAKWTFDTNAEGWVLAHSLTGTVNNGVYNLTIRGSDPYMLSPDQLNINGTTFGLIKIRLQNCSSNTAYQLFWTTTTDNAWNQDKSVFFYVNKQDTQQSDYEISMLSKYKWEGSTIKQIRLDPGDDNAGEQVKIDQISIEAMPDEFGLNNGVVHVRQDLDRGGSISFVSKSSDFHNLVNTSDEGRYIQQSYYAGNDINRQSEGQSPSWSPWAWNPIQAGDYCHNRARILSSRKGTDTLYVKCIPMLWDMNNKPAEAEMEQWTVLDKNAIKVTCRLTCHRTDNIYGENISRSQELPAVYPISALCNLYSYFGAAPYTNAAMANTKVVNLSSGFWGIYNSVTESWMAFVDGNQWGMGVYNPSTTNFFAGMLGDAGFESTNGATSYIAPTQKVALLKNSVYEYSYYIIIGSLTDIRSTVYSLHSALVASTPQAKKENTRVTVSPNPACDRISVNVPPKSTIEIYNAQGQLVNTSLVNDINQPIAISTLQRGFYFLKVKSGNETFAGKFLKN